MLQSLQKTMKLNIKQKHEQKVKKSLYKHYTKAVNSTKGSLFGRTTHL